MIISKSGIVNGYEVLYKQAGKSFGIIGYLSYEKGDETQLNIRFESNDSDIDANFYKAIMLDDSEVLELVYELKVSGRYRIPIPVGANEDNIKIVFEFVGSNPTTEGKVNIEFREDNIYR